MQIQQTAILVLISLLSSFLLISAENLSTGEDVDAYVERRIREAHVMVFAKSYCPFCQRTRALLTEKSDEMDGMWKLDIVDLDQLQENDGALIQMELLTKTGQKTVPNIFIGGKHIGGNSDLMKLNESGELEEILYKL